MPMSSMGVGNDQTEMMIYQILEAEQEPIMNMHEQTIEANQKIEAYQNINSALDTFKRNAEALSSDTFSYVGESSDEGVATAQVSSDANVGSYDIDVGQLAQSQRIVSTAEARGDLDISGLGGDSFHLGTEDNVGFEVTLDDDIEELSDIADAINDAQGNDDIVQAVVIEDNLVLEVVDPANDLVVGDLNDGDVLESLGILKENEDYEQTLYTSTIDLSEVDLTEKGELSIEFDEEEYSISLGEEGGVTSVNELLTALEEEIASDDIGVELTEDDQIVIRSAEEIDKIKIDDNIINDINNESTLYTLDSEYLKENEEYDADSGEGVLLQGSQRAEATINGISVTSDTNQLDEAVEGISFDLHQVGETTIDFDVDKEGVRESIEEFVEGYNAVIDMIDLYTNPMSSVESKDVEGEEGGDEVIEGGLLQGESQLRNLQASLYNSIVMPVEGSDGEEKTLSQFGIQVQRDGRLEIQDDRGWGQSLDQAIENDLDGLKDLFTKESKDYIEVDDPDDISDLLDGNQFSLSINGEEKTLELEEEDKSLEGLIEAINNDDEFSRVIAREDDNANLELVSFRNLEHNSLTSEAPGIIDRLGDVVDTAVDPHNGYIGSRGGRSGRIANLENEIDRTNERIERDLDRLEERENELRAQFARMEQLTAEMQAQQQQLVGMMF
ncbi:flagellar filament capping protein FliD [Halonatronum saccharophilum]|uniref:flagellar filament capping protein FliD n=1 Tax=Halonatronum saccharophilum TaxID=150060 RepID=UPI00047F1EF3|nr:flagellar filament capping protein FliD [Halonatronum saccharophilum]